jgi:hypothetical protein
MVLKISPTKKIYKKHLKSAQDNILLQLQYRVYFVFQINNMHHVIYYLCSYTRNRQKKELNYQYHCNLSEKETLSEITK